MSKRYLHSVEEGKPVISSERVFEPGANIELAAYASYVQTNLELADIPTTFMHCYTRAYSLSLQLDASLPYEDQPGIIPVQSHESAASTITHGLFQLGAKLPERTRAAALYTLNIVEGIMQAELTERGAADNLREGLKQLMDLGIGLGFTPEIFAVMQSFAEAEILAGYEIRNYGEAMKRDLGKEFQLNNMASYQDRLFVLHKCFLINQMARHPETADQSPYYRYLHEVYRLELASRAIKQYGRREPSSVLLQRANIREIGAATRSMQDREIVVTLNSEGSVILERISEFLENLRQGEDEYWQRTQKSLHTGLAALTRIFKSDRFQRHVVERTIPTVIQDIELLLRHVKKSGSFTGQQVERLVEKLKLNPPPWVEFDFRDSAATRAVVDQDIRAANSRETKR